MASLQSLFELQKTDTELSQLAHRIANLQERAVLARAKAALAVSQSEHQVVNDQLKSTKSEIESLEVANKKCESQLDKYAKQLKAVIAPREAEVLQREIETVRAERSANDDKELTLLEIIESLQAQLMMVSERMNAQKTDVEIATASLNDAIKVCNAQKTVLDQKRLTVSGTIETKLLKLYDIKRDKRATPAVADLHGSKCQSCHLDLSVVELAALKKLGSDELAECPNCDCYLVL